MTDARCDPRQLLRRTVPLGSRVQPRPRGRLHPRRLHRHPTATCRGVSGIPIAMPADTARVVVLRLAANAW